MNIDKIILKLFRRNNSLEELEILEAWKKESDDNIGFIKLMNTAREGTEYHSFNTDKAWKKVNKRLSQPISFYIRLLLVLLVAAAIAFGVYVFSNTEEPLPVFQSLDKVEHYALKDNSELWLNKGSQLAMLNDFTNSRRVGLTGEAFFDVAPDASNPFIIELNESDYVRVIGTSFNLVNEDDNFDLIVYSGIVELHTLNRSIRLEQQDRVTKLKGAYVKLKNKGTNAISWKTGELFFDDVPLVKVFSELESYFNCTIEYKGIEIGPCRLRSRYQNPTLEDIFAEFEQLFEIKYTRDKNAIYIEDLLCR